RRVDRLTMDRHAVRQVPGIGPGLAVAIMHHAVDLQADALDAARKVGRPGHTVRIVAADLLDRGPLRVREIVVPAELLEYAVCELQIAVGEFGALGVGAVGEQRYLAGRAVRKLLLALHAKTGA